jgi:PKHD-type hydroxylase
MNYSYVVITKAFPEDFCDHITNNLAQKFPEENAPVGPVATRENVSYEGRKSKIRWIAARPDTMDLYNCFQYFITDINRKHFGFDISFGIEPFQYTEYWGSEKGHYSWHMDSHYGTFFSDRKLSMSLQLSDPSEYEGGLFAIDKHANPQPFDMAALHPKGSIIVFPSYIQHCVTPVTNGVRRSLVAWWNGPAYK